MPNDSSWYQKQRFSNCPIRIVALNNLCRHALSDEFNTNYSKLTLVTSLQDQALYKSTIVSVQLDDPRTF